MTEKIWRALVLINEVNLRRARLVLGWVTVSGFDSRGHHFISPATQVDSAFYPLWDFTTKGQWYSGAGE